MKKKYNIYLVLIVFGLIFAPYWNANAGQRNTQESSQTAAPGVKQTSPASPTLTPAPGVTTLQPAATPSGARTIQSAPEMMKVPSVVTGVAISPASPEVGEKIKVTVNGTPQAGDCQILLLKGDGSAWSTYGNSTGFPYESPLSRQNSWLSYNSPGTYTLKVKGQSTAGCNCSGQAQVTFSVKEKPGLTKTSTPLAATGLAGSSQGPMASPDGSQAASKTNAAAMLGKMNTGPSMPTSGGGSSLEPMAAPSAGSQKASKTKAASMKEMMDKVPPVLTVNNINPLGVSANFHITASKPAGSQAGLKLRLFTSQPIAGTDYCEAYLSNFLYETFTFNQVTQWNPKFVNLTPETQLFYVLCTTGNTPYEPVSIVGEFNTGKDPNAPVLGVDTTTDGANNHQAKLTKAAMAANMLEQAKANAPKLNISVEPHSTFAKFNMTSDKPATQKLRVFTSPIPAGRECDESYPPFKAASSWGEKTSWGTTFSNLPKNTTYYYEGCVSDNSFSRDTGCFATGGVNVQVKITQVYLKDDGDDTSAGEIMITMTVNGVQKELWMDGVNSGVHMTMGQTWNFAGGNIPEEMPFEVKLGDCDSDFCNWEGSGSYSTYADWGIVSKTINTDLGTEPEYVKDYVWSAEDHGVDFDVSVQVKLTQ